VPVYNYTILDDPSSVGFTTNAKGINSAGQVVGHYDNNSGEHGFLYSSGTYITIDDPLATGLIEAVAINDTGLIVGHYLSNNSTHGFIFNPSTGKYSTIDRPGASSTEALGINKAGQIVGTYTDGSGQHGFLLNGGLFTTIDEPFATQGTVATGINNLGQIVGYYYTVVGFGFLISHGFLYNPSNSSFTTLEDPLPQGLGTAVYGINDVGQIVGNYINLADGSSPGFLYNGGTYTRLDAPNA